MCVSKREGTPSPLPLPNLSVQPKMQPPSLLYSKSRARMRGRMSLFRSNLVFQLRALKSKYSHFIHTFPLFNTAHHHYDQNCNVQNCGVVQLFHGNFQAARCCSRSLSQVMVVCARERRQSLFAHISHACSHIRTFVQQMLVCIFKIHFQEQTSLVLFLFPYTFAL